MAPSRFVPVGWISGYTVKLTNLWQLYSKFSKLLRKFERCSDVIMWNCGSIWVWGPAVSWHPMLFVTHPASPRKMTTEGEWTATKLNFKTSPNGHEASLSYKCSVPLLQCLSQPVRRFRAMAYGRSQRRFWLNSHSDRSSLILAWTAYSHSHCKFFLTIQHSSNHCQNSHDSRVAEIE